MIDFHYSMSVTWFAEVVTDDGPTLEQQFATGAGLWHWNPGDAAADVYTEVLDGLVHLHDIDLELGPATVLNWTLIRNQLV